MGSKKLTAKQKMFCKEYLIDLNATQAAIRAGYSEKTAKVIGNENLSKPYLNEYIQQLMNKRANKAEISAENVLNDILDIRDTLKNNTVKTDINGNEEIDTSVVNARLKANELLGKHLKLFTDKVETTVDGELNVKFNIPRPKNKNG